jgi:hypothetical protein
MCDARCNFCATSSGCEQHGRFTCATCGSMVSWSDGCDDDRPDDCSTCWTKWYGAMQAIAAGLALILEPSP